MNIFKYFTPKSDTFYLRSDATVRQAMEKLDKEKFGVVPLLDSDGMYVSTVSEGDILRFIKKEARFNIDFAERMPIIGIDRYRPYSACKIDVPANEVLKLALDQNFVPIVDDRGLFMGIIKRKTIIELLLDYAPEGMFD